MDEERPVATEDLQSDPRIRLGDLEVIEAVDCLINNWGNLEAFNNSPVIKNREDNRGAFSSDSRAVIYQGILFLIRAAFNYGLTPDSSRDFVGLERYIEMKMKDYDPNASH